MELLATTGDAFVRVGAHTRNVFRRHALGSTGDRLGRVSDGGPDRRR